MQSIKSTEPTPIHFILILLSLLLFPLLLLIQESIDLFNQVIILQFSFEIVFDFASNFAHDLLIRFPFLFNCRPPQTFVPIRKFLQTTRNILVILDELLQNSDRILKVLIGARLACNHVINSLVQYFKLIEHIIADLKIELPRLRERHLLLARIRLVDIIVHRLEIFFHLLVHHDQLIVQLVDQLVMRDRLKQAPFVEGQLCSCVLREIVHFLLDVAVVFFQGFEDLVQFFEAE